MGMEGFFVVLFGILVLGLCLIGICVLLRWWLRALLVVGVTLLSAMAWILVPVVDPVANLLLFPDDTIYSQRYTESKFERIKLGSARREVFDLIGEPLSSRLESGGEYLYYSRRGPRYPNYWNRIVIVDPSTDSVVQKVDEFYSD